MYPSLHTSGRERAPIFAGAAYAPEEQPRVRSIRLQHLGKSILLDRKYAFRTYHRTRYFTLRIEGAVENITDYTYGGNRYQSIWVRVSNATIENRQISGQQIPLPRPGELFEIPVSRDILSAQDL